MILSFSLAQAGRMQRVCAVSLSAQQNGGVCRTSPWGDGDICYFDGGSGPACSGSLIVVQDPEPPIIAP
ncbi:hypothetical protein [Algoriphagus sp.]|uniref:hypothetical protein n=1 Tax=Algoriphagus sp. TaxID=1872435 RepID=UPI00391B3D04